MSISSEPPSGVEASGPAPTAEPQLFTRAATGLVREISIKDAFNINMGMANPGLGFAVLPFILALYPNANLSLPIIIAAIGMLLLVVVYTQLVRTMPRSGGDYVFISRIFSPTAGSSIGGAWVIILLIFGAIGVEILATDFIPGIFSTLGQTTHNGSFTSIGNTLSEHGWEFATGGAILVILALLMYYGLRVSDRILLYSFVFGLLGFVVALIVLLAHSNSSFNSAFKANTGVSVARVIAAARKDGWHSGTSLISSLAVLPYAMILFNGFTWAAFPAGELRSASRTYPRSVTMALGVCFLMFLGLWLVARHVMGASFLSAANYVSGKPNSPLAAGVSLSDYTTYLTSSWVLGLFLSLSFVAWAILYMVSYYICISRILFALAFDRVIPQRVAAVTKRTAAPMVASSIVAVAMMGVFALSIFTNYLSIWTNGTLGVVIVYVIACGAAAILPFRRKDLYEAAPKLFENRVGGIPVMSYVAGLGALAFVGLGYAVIKQSAVFGPITLRSIGICVAEFAWAAVALWVGRWWWKSRRGIDLSVAQHALPPE